jgi:5-methylcytosine-specific restriction endonuclease McrA
MNNDKLTFEQHVQSECLCLLGYFAYQAGRAKRSDIINELADATFAGKTPDLKNRKNWWTRKFGNITFVWNANGLAGAMIHGYRMPVAKGKGLSGHIGVQRRIEGNALRYFLEDLPKCVLLARQFIDQGVRMNSQIQEALFGVVAGPGSIALSPQEQEDVDLAKKASPEGAKKLVKHYQRERDAGLSRDAKAAFAKANGGKLFCQACGVEPIKVYGVEVIEAHHRIPLSKSEEGRVTEISDLIMLCPSCHRAVHRIPDCDFEALKLKLRL